MRKEYKYEDINTLEDAKNILIKEMENIKGKKNKGYAKSLLGEIEDELQDENEHINECNRLINDVVELLNETTEIVANMKCPMCEDGDLEHEDYNGTHIYKCNLCPFVAFEDVEYRDEENISQKYRKINYDYSSIKCFLYKVEVGVLLREGEGEYDCYNGVYDRKYGYYDENVAFFLDYDGALNYVKNYVDDGVNGTYGIISKLFYNSVELYGGNDNYSIDRAMYDMNSIISGGYMENYIDAFHGDLYDVNNVIYSLRKQKDKDHPYYLGKGNGDLIENFIKTKEEQVVDFMFDNDYINASEYDHWSEEDIICIDQKIVLLYLTLEEMRKLHLAVEEEERIRKMIEEVLIKYEKDSRTSK